MNLEDAKHICYELIKRLLPRAEELLKLSPQKENTAWTSAVKAVLEEIGGEQNRAYNTSYESIYSSTNNDLHEFLLDFVWWDRNEKSMVLACECEFGNPRNKIRDPERIAEDFDKLLSVKSHVKLMIFDSAINNTKDQQTEILANIHNRFREFGQHISGEIYLLLDTRKLDDSTMKRFWVCIITQNGHDNSLEFREISANQIMEKL